MLAVLLPSRGLVHSRTVEDLQAALQGYDYHLFLSHGLPIPDAQNYVTHQALKSTADHFLYIEEDMALPPTIVGELFAADADISTADYPVRGNQHTVTYIGGKFAYAGFGCTLVKRQVFDKLKPPYFRTNTEYQIEDDKLIPRPRSGANYGLFDVDFYQRALQAGFHVKVIPRTAGQYFLVRPELPRYYNTSGLDYEVERWEF